MPVSREISRTVLWVCGVSSWLRNRSLTVSTFSSVRHFVVSSCLRVCWLCRCLLSSSLLLLILLFVHHLFGNSFNNSVALYRFNWQIFLIKILSSLLQTVFTKHCADVCKDLILMPVSRGTCSSETYFTRGNVITWFCSKFNRLFSCKEFLNSVTLWRNYRQKRMARFVDTM